MSPVIDVKNYRFIKEYTSYSGGYVKGSLDQMDGATRKIFKVGEIFKGWDRMDGNIHLDFQDGNMFGATVPKEYLEEIKIFNVDPVLETSVVTTIPNKTTTKLPPLQPPKVIITTSVPTSTQPVQYIQTQAPAPAKKETLFTEKNLIIGAGILGVLYFLK